MFFKHMAIQQFYVSYVHARGRRGMILNAVDKDMWAVYFSETQTTDYFPTEDITLLNSKAIKLVIETC